METTNLILYLIGVVIGYILLWKVDVVAGNDRTWDELPMNLIISFFSWVTVGTCLFLLLLNKLSDCKLKYPKWL